MAVGWRAGCRPLWHVGPQATSTVVAPGGGGLAALVRLDGDAPVEDLGGAVGGVEFAARGGFGEDLPGTVAAAFGLGEAGSQSGPGRVGQDSFGVLGDGRAQVLLVALGGLGLRCSASKGREGGLGGVLVGGA
ncbi:hypothetical protein AN217_09600 [Streptomyces qinglanensis]|uniref:Uncharacterized protein n=1 Tax=Streptomyces qinglanensis TaxID=943816 RepID=A0A1E7K280_9ACTN|nr:hypothetical protein AN217_09600 [Streptomyces qinglanensis]OEV24331.1 hypothetical protein AN220_19600 [Streptomyces nanshensis]